MIGLKKSLNNELNTNDLCITLDDNLKSQLKYDYHLLKKHNIKAFFFIYTSVYEKKNYEFEVFRYFYNVKYKSFKIFLMIFINI